MKVQRKEKKKILMLLSAICVLAIISYFSNSFAMKHYEETDFIIHLNFTADSDAISGTRYEGEIDNKINGVFVMFKVNDKTAILQIDSTISPDLLEEYEKITQSLRRNTN